jgi:hypothetical protein
MGREEISPNSVVICEKGFEKLMRNGKDSEAEIQF